jgi:hypothetical protein
MREGRRVQQGERVREGRGKVEKGKVERVQTRGGKGEGLLFTFQAFFWDLLFLLFQPFLCVCHVHSGITSHLRSM